MTWRWIMHVSGSFFVPFQSNNNTNGAIAGKQSLPHCGHFTIAQIDKDRDHTTQPCWAIWCLSEFTSSYDVHTTISRWDFKYITNDWTTNSCGQMHDASQEAHVNFTEFNSSARFVLDLSVKAIPFDAETLQVNITWTTANLLGTYKINVSITLREMNLFVYFGCSWYEFGCSSATVGRWKLFNKIMCGLRVITGNIIVFNCDCNMLISYHVSSIENIECPPAQWSNANNWTSWMQCGARLHVRCVCWDDRQTNTERTEVHCTRLVCCLLSNP